MIFICPHCKHKHEIQSEDLDFLNQREFITCNNCFCNFLINPKKNTKQQANIKIVSKKREYKNVEHMSLFELCAFLFTFKTNRYNYYKANFFDSWARNFLIISICLIPLEIVLATPEFLFFDIIFTVGLLFFLRIHAYHLERDKNEK